MSDQAKNYTRSLMSGQESMPYDSTYSVVRGIYNELGGEARDFDSTYSIVLAILQGLEDGTIVPGGSVVSISNTLDSGSRVATITINGTATDILVPDVDPGEVVSPEELNEATASVKNWVEEQGYASTSSVTSVSESVNALSSSVANDFANLDIPDISGLATTQSVNALSESVAASIEGLDIDSYAKSSDVTASINEASESVKTWVGQQGYLTQHQSLAGLFASTSYDSTAKKIKFFDKDSTLSGEIDATAFIKDGMVDSVSIDTGSAKLIITFNTDAGKENIELDLTEIFNPNNYYDKNGVNALITGSIQEVETWVGNQGFLTEHQDISNLATTSSVQDVSSSVSALSSSVADDFANLDIPDVSGLATTSSVNTVSESVSQLSSSVANDFENLDIPDVSGLATTSSVIAVSESVSALSSSVATDFANLDIPDVSGLATTSSVTQLSESVANDFANLDIPDVSGLATTSSVTSLSSSVANDFANLDIPDVSGLATTQSVTELSSSVASDFANLDIPDVSGLATTSSVNSVSESVSSLSSSVADDFANLDIPDISGLETTASFNEYSSSMGTVSASFDQRINSISSPWSAGSNGGAIIGDNPYAEGEGAVAQGSETSAAGDYSHAEGETSHAEGYCSHAEGSGTNASESYSHAEGQSTEANGVASHAEGYQTVAENAYEHAEGLNNAPATDQIFSIGAGDEVTRRNAVSVIKHGNSNPSASIYVYGIGGYNGTNPQTGSNDLATVIGNISGSVAAMPVIPSGSYSLESWTFTLTDSSSVTKSIIVG